MLLCAIVILHNVSVAQENCSTPPNSNPAYVPSPILLQDLPLVVVYVDFLDSRKADGSFLTSDADTVLIGTDIGGGVILNENAIGSFGYIDVKTVHAPKRKVRKYTYDDYWDMIFSKNTDPNPYTGTFKHPDYTSHHNHVETNVEQFDLTVYGSVRDYWYEVSYGNARIIPFITRGAGANKYETGIVNNIITVGNNKYIDWIRLPKVKSEYQIAPLGNPLGADTYALLRALRDAGQISFNIDTYTGRVAIVGAGALIGGWTDGVGGSVIYYAEKMGFFIDYPTQKHLSIFEGATGIAHEFGHTLGLGHLVCGSWDLMFWGGFGSRKYYFCPPHINPLWKIQLGWIPSSNITKISQNTSSIILEPVTSASSPHVVVITFYGDAGRFNDWESHSEYFIIEYRKREKFNRYAGGIDASLNSTFANGGALIWHYSAYSTFPVSGDLVSGKLGLKIPDYYNNFAKNNGATNQLFYPNNNELSENTTLKSRTVGNIRTGLSLNSFSYSSLNLTFQAQFNDGTLPQWDNFITDNISDQTLSGNIFWAKKVSGSDFNPNKQYKNITLSLPVSGGTTLHLPPNFNVTINGLNVVGTQSNTIKIRGAGFGSNNAAWDRITFTNYFENVTNYTTVLKYCEVSGGINGFVISRPFVEYELENNTFNNNQKDMTLNDGDPSMYTIDGTTYFPKYSNNSARLSVENRDWYVHTNRTISIPSSGLMSVNGGITLSMASGAGIYSYGKLNFNGTVFQPITFTSQSGTTPGSWGSITLNGAGASGSNLNGVIMQYGHAIECYSGANATINNCTLQNNTYGVICEHSSPIISNNIIQNISVHGVQSAWDANPRIENNTIINSVISSGYGVYVYSASGYINSNTISRFTVGVYPRTYSYLGAWSGDPAPGRGYNYTPTQNNIITGNTYGVDTYDNSWAFMGRYDYSTGMIHGGNNHIENNYGYDLVANDYTGLYGEGNWYNNSFVPTYAQGANVYIFAWSDLRAKPKGGGPPPAMNQKQLTSLSKKTTVVNIDTTTSQLNNSVNGEDKLFEEAVSDQMNKSYGNAQKKYKKLFSSKKYSQSALVLLSRLFIESNDDDNGLVNFEDIKSNPQKHTLDAGDISLTTNLLANMHGHKGNYDKALTLYDDVIKKYPNTLEERNARVQKIYYSIEGKKDHAGARQMLNELLAIYKSGDDIDMIINLVDHALVLSGEGSKSLPKQSSQESNIEKAPIEYSLSANYPNPFNPTTVINYQLPVTNYVSLKIYDGIGREVATLVNETKEAGNYEVKFDASKLASGVYFYKLKAGNFTSIKKMILIK